jgi:large subunit ribosomal protein L9
MLHRSREEKLVYMKVILTENIEALGNAGTVKEVANGYARNYLLPRGLALPATADALKRLERQRAAIERRAANAVNEARGMADRLGITTIYIYAKSGEQNRLYGSVTTADIAAALAEQHGLTIDRRNIALDEPIHRLGNYTANVKLAGGAAGKLNLVVDNEANRGKPRPEAAPAAAATFAAEAAPVAEAATAEAAPAAEASTAEVAPIAPLEEAVTAAEANIIETAPIAEAATAAEAITAEATPIAEADPAEVAHVAEVSATETTPIAEAATAAEATNAEAAPIADAAPAAEAADPTAIASVASTMTGESMVIEPHPQVVISDLETDTSTSNAGESSAVTAIATPTEETAPVTEAQAAVEDE